MKNGESEGFFKLIPTTLCFSCRDGSAVELVGLCYSTVSFLSKMNQQSIYPHSGVQFPSQEGGSE